MKTVLNSFVNSVDPDQLTSKKPADQDPHCFPYNILIDDNQNMKYRIVLISFFLSKGK